MKIQSNAMDRIRQLNTRTLREAVGLQEVMRPDDPKRNMPLGGGSGGGVPFKSVFDPKNPSKTPGSFKAKADAAASKTKPETLGSAPSGRNYGVLRKPTQAQKDTAFAKMDADKARKAAAGGGGSGKPPTGSSPSGGDNMPREPNIPNSDKKALGTAAIAMGGAGAIAIAANQLSKDDKKDDKPAASAQPGPAWLKPALDAAKSRDDELDNKRKNNDAVVAQAAAAAKSRDDDYAAAQKKNSETIAKRATEIAAKTATTGKATTPPSPPAASTAAPATPPAKAASAPATSTPPASASATSTPTPPAGPVAKAEPAKPIVKKVSTPPPVAAKTPTPAPQPVAAKPAPDNISPEDDISPEAKAAGEKKGVNAEKLRAFVAAANKNRVPTGPTESVQSKARSASFVFERIRNITEGRPSQRHPLEGHDYHKKSNDELVYIAKDAHKAAEAMKNHNTTAENKYRDQANDSATVRYYRQKSGMPDWYKKKYGHLKEEGVPVPPIPKDPPSKTDKSGIVTQKKLQTGGSAGGSRYPWNNESVQLPEAKEKTEYDYEGDMARGQLQSIISNAQRVHDMLEDNDNLAEWVQSKITLAEDYISTVANYMMSEVDEEVQLDELNKDTLYSYSKKAEVDQDKQFTTIGKGMRDNEPKSANKAGHKFSMRSVGLNRADKRLQKEEQIEELSSDLLGRYKKSAGAQASAADKSGDYAKGNKRFSGIMKATKKQFANDTKQGVAEGATGAKPGFMLRQDPELAKKLKDQLARKKKLPQGADFAAQRRKERLASNGRMDEAVESHQEEWIDEAGPGLWANIHAKRQRIKQGSKERMRNPGEKGAPESGALEKARGTNEEVKGEYERKVDKYLKKKYAPDDNKAPPFDPPYAKMPKADKSGAIHSPMSRAKHLAKMAGRKQAGIKENSHDEQGNINTLAKRSLSKTAGMVKTILKGAKSKNKNLDKFENEPELSSQIVKQE